MPQITTYEAAKAYLDGGRDKDYRPLPGRSTAVVYVGGPEKAIAIRYHNTDVVTFTPGQVRLDSGGWRTMTSKERMSTYSPVNVSQSNGLWYVGHSPVLAERLRVLFEDGITFTDAGELIGEASDGAGLEAAKRKVDRMVAKYIRGYCAHLREVGHVEPPDAGDCWYCLMRTVDGGEPLGDAIGNVDHLLSHFEEGYHVPSLLVRAIEERGYGGGVGFIVASTNIDLEQGRNGKWALGHVKDSLRAYFRRRKLALAEEVMRQSS